MAPIVFWFAGLVLLPLAAEAQTSPAFEIAFGPQYGLQDPERPATPGWIVSSGLDLGGRTFVVEGSWHLETYVDEHLGRFDELYRNRNRSRYWMLTAGIKSNISQGGTRLYYQVLVGGFSASFRTDHEWPAWIDTEAEAAACGHYFDGVLVNPCRNVPYPEFVEQSARAFVVLPGMGVDVDLWRQLTLRLAADLPLLLGSDDFVYRPRLSAQLVVALAR